MDRSLQSKDKRFTLAEFMQAYDKLHRYFHNAKALNPGKKEEDECGEWRRMGPAELQHLQPMSRHC